MFVQVKDGTVGGKENEKEVSRPVSLSSLGSCSSSGSSGANQPSSIYLASTESLDSDPEPTGSQGNVRPHTTLLFNITYTCMYIPV